MRSDLPVEPLMVAALAWGLAARIRDARRAERGEAVKPTGEPLAKYFEGACVWIAIFSLCVFACKLFHADSTASRWHSAGVTLLLLAGLPALCYCVMALVQLARPHRLVAQAVLTVLVLGGTGLLVVRWPQVTAAGLRAAAGGGHPTAALVWIKLGAPVNVLAPRRLRPLELAARTGSERTLEVLLEAGAQVNAPDAIYGATALHFAGEEGHVPCVKLLLDRGADPNARARFAETPLFWAAGGRQTAAAAVLLARGAVPSLRDAAALGDLELTRTVMAQGANVNARDAHGCTPLHWAIYQRHADEVSCLLAFGADPRQFAYTGEYPLQDAVFAKSRPLVEILLRGGAPPDLPDQKWHATALHYAASKGYLDIAQALLAAGANVNAADYSGATPLDWAVHTRHRAVTDLLRAAGGRQQVPN